MFNKSSVITGWAVAPALC